MAETRAFFLLLLFGPGNKASQRGEGDGRKEKEKKREGESGKGKRRGKKKKEGNSQAKRSANRVALEEDRVERREQKDTAKIRMGRLGGGILPETSLQTAPC